MRLRCGLVSNSSSSSFVIKLSDLTPEQVEQIMNFREEAEQRNLSWYEHAEDWDVRKNDYFITGGTYLDNFQMEDLFEAIGVPADKVDWREWHLDMGDLVASMKEEWESMKAEGLLDENGELTEKGREYFG